MENLSEIKSHIESVRETNKITNAMYLIASAKMRRAKAELDKTRPYFDTLKGEIKRVFRVDAEANSKYFYPAGEAGGEIDGAYGYLVITADKGLAGAYNQNVLVTAQKKLAEHNDNKVFLVGEYGRRFFASRNIPIEQSFVYTAQNPTFNRARKISETLLDLYNSGKLKKIFVIYTDLSGMSTNVCVTRLLPFHRADFITDTVERHVQEPFEFNPSMEAVLDSIVPSYVSGFIYSALVDSFCSEQESRMSAMDAANRSASELLDKLLLDYNHQRQNEITRAITEITAGSRARQAQLEADKKRKERAAQ